MKNTFVILSLCFFFCCKNTNTDQARNTITQAATLPEDFEAFYDKFHSDSLFQIAHIQFPLAGYPAHASSVLEEDESFSWKKKDWIMHKEFQNENREYDRRFEIISDGLIIETISHMPSDYKMQRRYSKSGEDWQLIYYMAMNKSR